MFQWDFGTFCDCYFISVTFQNDSIHSIKQRLMYSASTENVISCLFLLKFGKFKIYHDQWTPFLQIISKQRIIAAKLKACKWRLVWPRYDFVRKWRYQCLQIEEHFLQWLPLIQCQCQHSQIRFTRCGDWHQCQEHGQETGNGKLKW